MPKYYINKGGCARNVSLCDNGDGSVNVNVGDWHVATIRADGMVELIEGVMKDASKLKVDDNGYVRVRRTGRWI